MARPLVKHMPHGQVMQFLDVLVRAGLTANLLEATLRDNRLAGKVVSTLERESGEGRYEAIGFGWLSLSQGWQIRREAYTIFTRIRVSLTEGTGRWAEEQAYKLGKEWVQISPFHRVRDADDNVRGIFILDALA